MAQGGPDLRVNLHQLLKAMVEKGASDMHITAGAPPLLRIDGEVIPLKLPPLSPVDTKHLCYSIMTEEQKIHFEKKSELAAIHPEAAQLSLERAAAGSPAAYHPGALRYYAAQKLPR